MSVNFVTKEGALLREEIYTVLEHGYKEMMIEHGYKEMMNGAMDVAFYIDGPCYHDPEGNI
jgi:hypothetical protein